MRGMNAPDAGVTQKESQHTKYSANVKRHYGFKKKNENSRSTEGKVWERRKARKWWVVAEPGQ